MADAPPADPLAWLADAADAQTQRGLERRLVALGPARPGRVVHQGRELVNFASNDYLGLASDPRVIAAAAEAAAQFGWGAGASPLVSGWREPHEALAEGLARFEGVEAVTLFPSGFAANLGAIVALVGPGDAVYLDRLAHACLVDGARLAGARLRIFPHNDADRLGAILERDRGRFRRSLIATEGVFSMDGDLAPVAALADLADQHGAILLVDEAHATGVVGPTGRGATEAAGVEPTRVPVRVGTLSKALGSVGGFVAGSTRLAQHLRNHARTLIYSTGLPPAAAAGAHQALRILIAEPWRRTHLRALVAHLQTNLGRPSLPTPLGGASPIVPVLTGDPTQTIELANYLRTSGFLVAAIRPPTVPAGTSRLRISLTAAHQVDEVTNLSDTLLAKMAVGDHPEQNCQIGNNTADPASIATRRSEIL